MVIDPNSSIYQELAAFEVERQSALVSGDPDRMAAILHDDLIHVHSSGMCHTKPEFIAHVGRMGGFVSITRGELEFRLAGDAAIITGSTVNRVRRLETGELADLNGFGTVVAVKGAQGWQVMLSQITVLKG